MHNESADKKSRETAGFKIKGEIKKGKGDEREAKEKESKLEKK